MLPQVTAFVLESLRWRPVIIGGPFIHSDARVCAHLTHVLGFAHRATADIKWKNYVIPKGATVIGNHWYVQKAVFVTRVDATRS